MHTITARNHLCFWKEHVSVNQESHTFSLTWSSIGINLRQPVCLTSPQNWNSVTILIKGGQHQSCKHACTAKTQVFKVGPTNPGHVTYSGIKSGRLHTTQDQLLESWGRSPTGGENVNNKQKTHQLNTLMLLAAVLTTLWQMWYHLPRHIVILTEKITAILHSDPTRSTSTSLPESSKSPAS